MVPEISPHTICNAAERPDFSRRQIAAFRNIAMMPYIAANYKTIFPNHVITTERRSCDTRVPSTDNM